MNLPDALRIASDLRDGIAPYCLRPPVVVGSISRGKPEVRDCEILVMPDPRSPRPEFGQPIHRTALDKHLHALQQEGILRKIKAGPVYRQYQIDARRWDVIALAPFHLDLFLVDDPATWGVQMVIRTGPAAFSQWCVTTHEKGGALPYGWHFDDRNPWHVTGYRGEVKPMPEEQDFLDFLGLGWIEPASREPRWK